MSHVFVLDTNKQPLAPTHPARARLLLTQGKAYVGRMSAKANGSFTIATATGSVPDIGHRYCVRFQRTDGYGYTFTKGAGGVFSPA